MRPLRTRRPAFQVAWLAPFTACALLASLHDDARAGEVLSQLASLEAFDDAEITGSVTASSDGQHVYVATRDGAVHAYARAPAGLLERVGEVRDDGTQRHGLLGASGMAIAPGGTHIYVASSLDDAVVLLERDPTTGSLAWRQMLRNGVDGVEGLDGARAVAVSPDGAHVYVGAEEDGAVAVFARDEADGALTFVGAARDGEAGVTGLDGIQALAFSAEGAFVYTGAHTLTIIDLIGGLLYSYTGTLGVFARDPISGLLTQVETWTEAQIPELRGLRSLLVSPDNASLWVSASRPGPDNEGGVVDPGAVLSFGRDLPSGMLTWMGTAGTTGARGIAATADGAHVYLARVLACSRFLFCSTGPVARYVPSETGLLAIDEEPSGNTESARMIAVPPGGISVYLAGKYTQLGGGGITTESVARYAREPATGALTLADDRELPRLLIGGAAAVAASSDCSHVYVTGSDDQAVNVFAVQPGTGALDAVQSLQHGAGGVEGIEDPRGIAISPDGNHVYVTSLLKFVGGDTGSVAAFARDPVSGALAFVEVQRDGQNGVDGIAGARDVVLSADGAFVYVAGIDDDAVAWFSRDGMTGALTWAGAAFDGVGGAEGLAGATVLALSPDGAQLYVTSLEDHAVAVFTRDSQSGALTFLEAQLDGIDGVTGLQLPLGLAVSPDGTQVFVASLVGASLAEFTRDPQTGALAFAGMFGGNASAHPLVTARAVLSSPDGRRLFVIGSSAHAIDRDPSTGALSHADSVSVNGGFGGALGCDAARLYVASRISSRLTTIAVPEAGAGVAGMLALATLAGMRCLRGGFRPVRNLPARP